MDTTPVLALPYPEPTDPMTDYPAVGQDLAELLETLMKPIFDVVLAAPQAAIDSNTILGGNLPTTFRHLELIVSARSVIAGTSDRLQLRYNNDASAIYDEQAHRFSNNFSTDDKGAAQTGFIQTLICGGTSPAGASSPVRILIPDYRSAVLRKTYLSQYGYLTADAAASMFIGHVMGQWRSTAAITRIGLTTSAGNNFATGSRFTLYGRL